MTIIDSDQHLVEYRGLWDDHIDPVHRDDAIRFSDDEHGNTWLAWSGGRLGLAEVQQPGQTQQIGDRRIRALRGEAPAVHYDEALPRDHWDPVARRDQIGTLGFDEAMLFPNFGLFWERRLSVALPALLANMRAWNRWCATVVTEGGGV